MPESRDNMIATILARYRQLCADHETAQENVERVQAHQRELMCQIHDCFAAARLFGFDLVGEFQREAQGDPRQPTLRGPDPITPPLAPVPAISFGREGPTIKTLVLNAAKAAYPHPIRAKEVRHNLGSSGHAIHEKTVGVVLYRLSVKGLVKRKGKEDWYFIPPDEPVPPTVNGRHYGPERVPEFIALVA